MLFKQKKIITFIIFKYCFFFFFFFFNRKYNKRPVTTLLQACKLTKYLLNPTYEIGSFVASGLIQLVFFSTEQAKE